MRTSRSKALVALGVSLLSAGCFSPRPQPAERTVDGLTRVATKRVDTVYTAPGMTLAPYRRVILDPVDVAFKRDWQRRHPEVTAEDVARIRSEAAKLFREVFARELEQRAFAIWAGLLRNALDAAREPQTGSR